MTDGSPDGDGTRVIERNADAWHIHEADSTSTPGAVSSRSLICESSAVVRRLWHFPMDWRALSDRAILDLFGIE